VLESDLPASLDTCWHSAHSDHNYSTVPQHQYFVHYCSSVVAAMQSEEIGTWGAESVAEEFEILDLQLALLVVHSAAQDGTQVLVMMNQYRI
jgi:hypothetical protein